VVGKGRIPYRDRQGRAGVRSEAVIGWRGGPRNERSLAHGLANGQVAPEAATGIKPAFIDDYGVESRSSAGLDERLLPFGESKRTGKAAKNRPMTTAKKQPHIANAHRSACLNGR